MEFAIFAGAYTYWGEFDITRLTRVDGGQMGGGETAAMSTAIELAKAGHTVVLGANVPRTTRLVNLGGQLAVVPADDFYAVACAMYPDVLLAWDASWLFRNNIPAKLRVLAFQLNDTFVGVFDHVIDAYLHPSEWHRGRFSKMYGIPKNKGFPLMTNGTDLSRFMQAPRTKSVVYCSSPDRGLHHLLRMWPAIHKAVPEAVLHIYYDMSKWLATVNAALAANHTLITTDRALEIQQLLPMVRTMNVHVHGGVSKPLLYRALAEASVLAYPCDPVAPTEGYSMTILDGWAAGCNVVTTDADALLELWSGKEGITILPLPIDDGTWTSTIISKLEDTPNAPTRYIPYSYTWEALALRWVKQFNIMIKEKEVSNEGRTEKA